MDDIFDKNFALQSYDPNDCPDGIAYDFASLPEAQTAAEGIHQKIFEKITERFCEK